MSQAHIDALLVARDKLWDGQNFSMYYALPTDKAGEELQTAVVDSLGGAGSLYFWLRNTHGDGEWDVCDDRVFNVKIRAAHLAWVDQMLIDWKDAP